MKDEIATNHAAQIPESAYIKLLNSIVRIKAKGQGTGFLLKFKKKNKQFFSLFTNHHVIPEDLVNSKTIINIEYGIKGSETIKQIKLDKNQREIFCFEKPKDVTVIEILESDNIPEDKYLLPDINYKNEGFNIYSNCDFYLAGYPSVDDIYNQYKGERHLSSGKIKNIFNNYEFEHTLDTRSGSSGSPICLISNKCAIGIHKSGNKNTFINKGTFIGTILDELENDGITIYCRYYNKRREEIKVNPNDRISILRNKLNINDPNYRFAFKCPLNEEKTFQFYHIVNKSCIIIVPIVEGG